MIDGPSTGFMFTDDAINPENCDAKWGELWDRFLAGD